MNPTRALKAADFVALAGEFVNPVNGYTETTRRPWTPGAPVNGSGDNAADIPTMTIATAAGTPGSFITVRGNALVTRSAKGSTAGVLLAISRYTNDRIAYHGDPYPLKYVVSLMPTLMAP